MQGTPTGAQLAGEEEATALAGPQPEDVSAGSSPAGAEEPQPGRRAARRQEADRDGDRPRFIVQEEHQIPRWDGSMKTMPRRLLRYPKWQL